MSCFDCRYHVTITPYQKHLVSEGVYAVDSSSFDPNSLTRCEWPPEEPCARLPEGGAGGEVVADRILVVWRDNKLICPISDDPKPLSLRRQETQIVYDGIFVAQLDGQVAYVPGNANGELPVMNGSGKPSNFIILVESPIAEIHAIRFPSSQAVIVDPFVKHSMPIPLDNDLEFVTWHRAVNGVLRENADPAGVTPIVVNMNKVDRVRPISVRRIGANAAFSLVKRDKSKVKSLSSNFSKDLRPLEDASAEALAPYGQFIPDFATHNEKNFVTTLKWPGSDGVEGNSSGILEQDFLVTWRSPLAQNDEYAGELLQLEFEGLSGSFVDERGRPGVEYSAELGTYRADLLMARPDGSFYIQPSDHSSVFAMAVALPCPENGNPIKESVHVFVFKNGSTLRLNPKIWHSVPVPLACTNTGILFREIVSATNANLVINVKAESGHPLQFV